MKKLLLLCCLTFTLFLYSQGIPLQADIKECNNRIRIKILPEKEFQAQKDRLQNKIFKRDKITYIVKKGDTVFNIARKYRANFPNRNLSEIVKIIKKNNIGLNINKIKPGNILYIER